MITDGSIHRMIQTLTENQDAGLVNPKFHVHDEPGKLDYAGCKELNKYTGRVIIIGRGENDNGQYDRPEITGYCHGGGVMIATKLLHEIGLMPEDYFLYYEELEWSEEIKRAGYKVYYEPRALIYHKVSSSIGLFSTLKTYYLTRNRILFMRRNQSNLNLFFFSLYFGLISIPKNLFSHMIKGRFNHMRYFMLAVLWNMGYKKAPKF